MPFYTLLAGVILACCAAIVLPIWGLARSGMRKTALAGALLLPALLTIDYFVNWNAISYPWWILAVPTFFYPFSMAACVIGIIIAARALFDSA